MGSRFRGNDDIFQQGRVAEPGMHSFGYGAFVNSKPTEHALVARIKTAATSLAAINRIMA